MAKFIKKKKIKKIRRDDNQYIAAALEWIFDECLTDVEVCIEQFAKDNAGRVEKIDWSRVLAEKILNDKSFRKSLLGTIQTCIEVLQDAQAEKLLNRTLTSLDDYQSQTGISPSRKLIVNAVKEFNYSNLPPKKVRGVVDNII